MAKIITLPKILLLILLLVVALSYSKVPFIFFQQDELYMFGEFIREGWRTTIISLSFKDLTHFVPVSLALCYGAYLLFGINHIVFNCLGLFVHLFNGFLIYQLSRFIFKNKTLSIISLIIFFSVNQTSEIIMWPVASLSTLSLSFVLIGWLYFLKKVEPGKKFAFTDGIIISLFFLIAVLIIEYSVMFALFFPALVLLNRKVTKESRLHLLLPFSLAVILYMLFRLIPVLFFGREMASMNVTANIPLISKLGNLLAVPFIYASQLFLGQNLLLMVSKRLSSDAFVVETEVYKYVALTVGVVIYISLIFLARKTKDNLAHLLLFVFSASLPFIIILGKVGNSWVLPSRYLYFGSLGYSLIITSLTAYAIKKRNIISYVFIMLALFIVNYGTYLNYSKSQSLYAQGKIRLNILSKIKESYPKLPQKTVFYFLSDASYYGLPEQEKTLPFQSGLGQTLLVWYAKTEKFPKEFFADRFLWDITSQGYKEIEGVGFGFFRDFEKMADVLKNNSLPPPLIISFRYNSVFNSFEDTTGEVRGGYLGYLAKKEEVNTSGYSIIAKSNEADIFLTTDGNRKTFWDSKVVYAYPQSLEIKLKRRTKIAQIQIDSYNNKDQNQVGYKVSLMDDSGNWNEVFYAKRYPPNADGIVNLYFEPTKTSGVKIEQMGYHAFATWVVHELKVYEKVD